MVWVDGNFAYHCCLVSGCPFQVACFFFSSRFKLKLLSSLVLLNTHTYVGMCLPVCFLLVIWDRGLCKGLSVHVLLCALSGALP